MTTFKPCIKLIALCRATKLRNLLNLNAVLRPRASNIHFGVKCGRPRL